jgi:hypothetical protein
MDGIQVTRTPERVTMRMRVPPGLALNPAVIQGMIDACRPADPFAAFAPCLGPAGDPRAELARATVAVEWDPAAAAGAVHLSCAWMSQYGCSDTQGSGTLEATVRVRFDAPGGELVFSAPVTPEPPSTREEF